ncbi:AglZ/HisF2 family acetamidino modification protein [Methanocella sp. MCL-LM]|uniref:AglZ/HisF2 family acetamidino modification protein n=1 Tax=Methanocella sp. MCL-LM TaxID=3412035 RepID=UPI003C7859DE
MLQIRVIPCLLLQGDGLVKTIQFKDPKYVGDPINAVRIYNKKEVDELIFLDILASRKKSLFGPRATGPRVDLIAKISDECFMPLAYGGGIKSVEQVRDILGTGVEKVSINTQAVEDPAFIRRAADIFGSQSIVVAIDAKRRPDGKYEVYTHGGAKPCGIDPVSHARRMEEMGAGEIFINSIDHDGMMNGYDQELIKSVSSAVKVPVIACGGAGRIEDFAPAVKAGASAVAAGSFFVFHGKRRAVLINYPARAELGSVLDAGREPGPSTGGAML